MKLSLIIAFLWVSTFIASGLSPEPLHWQERAPLPQPRAGYMAGVISGKLVIAGGSFWQGGKKVWTPRVDTFDPAENRWYTSTPMPEPRSDAASSSFGNALYVFGGGSDGEVRADAIVFQDGKWRRIPKATLPKPRLYATAVECRGSIYLIGGLSKPGDYSTASNTLWVWNPKEAKKGWKELPCLPGPGRINQAAAQSNGQIYVFGGATWDGANGVRNLSDAYQFDPEKLKWTRLSDSPIARRCWWAVNVHGRLLLLGGYSGAYEKQIFAYNPASKSFVSDGALPHAICDAKFFRVGNYLVGAGGESGSHIRAPWTFQAQLHGARKGGRFP
ncbi:MAG: Kelch repeat-containing protein [Terriglobia bacterium]